ncbi:MAG TPA: glycosyltransferase [Acidimicrobiales bacterium]|nr:glycosyltransferase [Acidimicrobiales bacterium]
MTIDVVIVTYNSADVLDACLDAVATVAGVARIIVVDHGNDGSGGRARARGAIVVADPSNPGYGAGQNRGRGMGDAPFILMLNPDAELDPAGVARGAALLDGAPDVAMVQGVIEAASGTGPERTAGQALAPLHLWGRALGLRALLQVAIVRKIAGRYGGLADHVYRAPAVPMDVDALAAVAVLARRDALDAIGGFDEERFFLYGEDMDLSRRLRDAGWRLVTLPDRWARHLSGASSASSWERELEWWRGTLAFAMRWWAAPARASARAAALVMAIRLIARRPRATRRAFALLR